MLHCKTSPGGTHFRFTKDPAMSRQLTLSSLFAVLAMAGLCVMASARDLAGFDAPAVHMVQAEPSPGLPA